MESNYRNGRFDRLRVWGPAAIGDRVGSTGESNTSGTVLCTALHRRGKVKRIPYLSS